MIDKTKVHLTKIQETLLITLHAKALDHRSKNSILNDKKADQIINMVDYDFGKLKSLGNDNLIVVRARQYDEWLKEFLNENPDAIVLNLGCGLDTRISRIGSSESVHWFDVDYPEVIRLRGNFYSNRDGYTMIGSSLTDPDWLAEIPNGQPAMIIAEGVLEYLTGEAVKNLLNRITGHFPQGQIAFDVMNSYAIRSGQSRASRTTGALHKWAVEDPEEVGQLDPKLKIVTELSLFGSPYVQKLPWTFRLIYGFMSLIPRYENMLRLLRYQF
ncbi:MAG TPA: class I SAM-dependent methyltransferase [Desulfomonilaceae bacterium]|nr:class I SAM-dependent methyltransferase [Desulfomonilaceae bacterium]